MNESYKFATYIGKYVCQTADTFAMQSSRSLADTGSTLELVPNAFDAFAARIVSRLGVALGNRRLGLWSSAASRWFLPDGAVAGLEAELGRALGSASRCDQSVLSVPLRHDGRLLGMIVVVVSTMAPPAEFDRDITDLIEEATLLLAAAESTSPRETGAGSSDAEPSIVAEMRRDLTAHRFVPHFQPYIELGTGGIVAFSALARWNHPERGWVGAADFLPRAERYGLAAEIGAMVLDDAAQRARRWLDGGTRRVRVSVKVSDRELADEEFVGSLSALLCRYRLPASTIGLLLPAHPANPAGTQLGTLRDAGFRITLDKVSMTQARDVRGLRTLPLYGLQIGGDLTRRVVGDPAARVEARAVVSTAKALGLQAFAEGVERAEQADVLTELGFDAALGFLWSPAVEPQVADSMMHFQPFRAKARPRA